MLFQSCPDSSVNGHTRETFPNDTSLGILLHTSILSALLLSIFLCALVRLELRSVTDLLENVRKAICVHRMISSYRPHTVTEYFEGPKMCVDDQ